MGSNAINAAEFELEHESTFKLAEVYKYIYELFIMELDYRSLDGDEVPESLYHERYNNFGGQEHHIWWRFEKVINPYWRYYIKFNIQTLKVNQVETMIDGKKKKANAANIVFRVQGHVIFDPDKQLQNHWLIKNFYEYYKTRWMKEKIDQHKKRLWFDLYHAADYIKQLLGMATHTEKPETYQPYKGL